MRHSKKSENFTSFKSLNSDLNFRFSYTLGNRLRRSDKLSLWANLKKEHVLKTRKFLQWYLKCSSFSGAIWKCKFTEIYFWKDFMFANFFFIFHAVNLSLRLLQNIEKQGFLDIQGLKLHYRAQFLFPLPNPKLPFFSFLTLARYVETGARKKCLSHATSNISLFLFLVSQKKRTTTTCIQ